MSRAKVEQVQCDRCKRVRLIPVAPQKAQPDFEMHFFGEHIRFDDVCDKCRPTMVRLVELIKEWERELTQNFMGPMVHPNAAPPVSAAPSLTPVQPHSAAGQRR